MMELQESVQQNKILVVEDELLNRYFLHKTLSSEYEILMAENGAEGLKLLKKYGQEVVVVILDLIMPVMDGYEFLRLVQEDKELSSIPVIVTTGRNSIEEEIRCLTSGASDYIPKPYKAEIVKHRVSNIIRLRESSSMLNLLKYDQLTKLYSREFFYQQVSRILVKYPDQKFDIICTDIENFKMINERYGEEKGDELLCYLAKRIRKSLSDIEICGRIGADSFAVLTKHHAIYLSDNFNEQVSEKITRGFLKSPIRNFSIKFGIYEIKNPKLPVSAMCDRAMMAIQKIKRHYGKCVTVYEESLARDQLKEQRILENMEQALEQKQFQVYYQPKHDLNKGYISGAEALVRWIHPEFGFMSPGDFIPLFEKNGFITNVDFYVWEETLRSLKEWQKAGLPVVPVSVNISRMDFNTPNLPEVITNLADKYGIDHSLLHLEVTESVYADNPQCIIDTVNELRNRGFQIEMDDFGSGYSSLNMLSELSIDVLKLDMRFMKENIAKKQDKSVLSFIIKLGEWLDLQTIAEGVETKEQVDALKELGCDYVQGYYFAKPMPNQDFEIYLQNNSKCN